MSRPTCLITGASRGIGRSVAHSLAADYRLLIGGRDATSVQALCARLPDAEPFVADLADEEVTAAAVDRLQRLDALVHSAGVAGATPLEDSNRDVWRQMFEVNLFAVMDLTRLALPLLTESRGTVCVVNSGAGYRASGVGGEYPASKFALRAFTDVLREEVRGRGIRVCAVHPGRVDTDMQRELQRGADREYDPADHLSPESVADAVKLMLDTEHGATIEELSIRPTRGAM